MNYVSKYNWVQCAIRPDARKKLKAFSLRHGYKMAEVASVAILEHIKRQTKEKGEA